MCFRIEESLMGTSEVGYNIQSPLRVHVSLKVFHYGHCKDDTITHCTHSIKSETTLIWSSEWISFQQEKLFLLSQCLSKIGESEVTVFWCWSYITLWEK